MRLVLLLAVLLVSPAQAAKLDLSTTTCEAFLASGDDNIQATLAWLDGYYKEEDDPPVLDSDKLVENAKKLGEFCAKNPSIGLITAADKTLNK